MAGTASGLPRLARLVAAGLVAVVVIAVAYVLLGGGTKTGTAYFSEVKSVYPGDAIRILGMEVGRIDKITAEGNKVRVDFHYNSKYSVPADVKAAIVSPTLVATRFIQLDPPYSGGPALPDGGVIEQDHTVVPVEFDELKTQLSQLSDALGPNGINHAGALNRALTVIDTNGRGQGQNFHDMITELSKAAKTLSDGRGDLFGTVRNLAQFSSVLNTMDGQIVEFDHRLADVSGTLSDNDDQLRKLLPRLDDAGHEVDRFLKDHGDQLTDTVDKAGSISRALAQQRDNIATILHVGPNALTNFSNLWAPSQQAVVGSLGVDQLANLGGPGDQLCAVMSSTAAANEKQGQDMCVKYLGPVFSYLAQKPPPVGVAPVVRPGGGVTPSYGDLETGQADTNHSPNGTNSDLPRSPTANGNDNANPGGLLGLMQGGSN
jgi:phospholipid/cholesterol/gamma-HCH transport system substrate-binding protein